MSEEQKPEAQEVPFYINRREIQLGGKTYLYQPGALKNAAASSKLEQIQQLLNDGKPAEATALQVETLRIWIPEITEEDLDGYSLLGFQALITRFMFEGMGRPAAEADDLAKKVYTGAVKQQPALAEVLSLSSLTGQLSESQSTSSPEGTPSSN